MADSQVPWGHEALYGAVTYAQDEAKLYSAHRHYTLRSWTFRSASKRSTNTASRSIPPTYADFDELAASTDWARRGYRPETEADVDDRVERIAADGCLLFKNVDRSVRWWTDERHSSHTSFPETVCGDILIPRTPKRFRQVAKRVETARLVIQGYAQSEPYYDQFLDQFIVEKDQMLENAEELRDRAGRPSYSPMAGSSETIRTVG